MAGKVFKQRRIKSPTRGIFLFPSCGWVARIAGDGYSPPVEGWHKVPGRVININKSLFRCQWLVVAL